MVTDRIGLIVNPIAGTGGAVGLKGSDGELAALAAGMGAQPVAQARAVTALQQLQGLRGRLQIVTAAGVMGETAVQQAGLLPTVVASPEQTNTTANDTRRATAAIVDYKPSLLLFAGGDGTARDIFAEAGDRLALLGIPAGVKMHSGVFAATPRAAGEVARRFLQRRDRASMLQAAEIVDREPGEQADDAAKLQMYGLVRVPRLSFLVPGAKAASSVSGQSALAAAIRHTAELVSDDRVTLIGPGATMLSLERQLGFQGTPLGVDAVRHGACIGLDLDEARILAMIDGQPARIVVTVIGGQGYLFGRGNQQLSARVIRAVGDENILVVSTLEKLAALPTQTLLVDTGDDDLDRVLAGHREVIVGGSRTVLMPVKVFRDDVPIN